MQFPERHGPSGPDGSSVDRGQGPGTPGGFGAPESYLPTPPTETEASRVNETLDALLALGPEAPRASGLVPGQAGAEVPDWLAREAGQDGPPTTPASAWPTETAVPAEASWAPPASPPPPGAHAEPASAPVADEEMQDVPLGTLIYRAGLLGAAELEHALEESVTAGKRLGEVLLDRGLIAERDLGRLLAGQKGLQFVELGSIDLDPAAAGLLPASSARVYGALPIRLDRGIPVVAVSDPTNGIVVEGVRRALGDPLLVVAARSDLQAAIERVYALEPGDLAPDAFAAPTPAAEAGDAAGSAVPETVVVVQPPPEHSHSMESPPLHSHPAEPHTMGSPTADPASPPRAESPAPLPAPVAATTAPQQHGEAVPPVADTVETFRVAVSLASGETVDVGRFSDPDQAIERARALARSVDQHDPGEWPLIGTRFVRPDTITSIELLEEKPRH